MPRSRPLTRTTSTVPKNAPTTSAMATLTVRHSGDIAMFIAGYSKASNAKPTTWALINRSPKLFSTKGKTTMVTALLQAAVMTATRASRTIVILDVGFIQSAPESCAHPARSGCVVGTFVCGGLTGRIVARRQHRLRDAGVRRVVRGDAQVSPKHRTRACQRQDCGNQSSSGRASMIRSGSGLHFRVLSRHSRESGLHYKGTRTGRKPHCDERHV